jgi:hypothetical protein
MMDGPGLFFTQDPHPRSKRIDLWLLHTILLFADCGRDKDAGRLMSKTALDEVPG